MTWSEHVYQYDGQGNTTALVDETSTVTDTFTYDAWGNEVARTGTTKTPFRWNGRVGYYWDEDTGTYQVRRRTYEPAFGRWLSEDILWPDEDIDAYSYVHNSSTNAKDPSGKSTEFELRPSELDSHPWKSRRLAGNYGETSADFLALCTCECSRYFTWEYVFCWAPPIPSFKCRYFSKYTVTGTTIIRIDQARIKRSGVSKTGVYGHEQLHAFSLREEMKRLVSTLKDFESDDSANCEAKCQVEAKRIDDEFQKFEILEILHQNPNSPEKYKTDYDPIGTMPKHPVK